MDAPASAGKPLRPFQLDVLEEDELDQRNNFLHLLLGLVSVAEAVLRAVPAASGALTPEPEAVAPETVPRVIPDLLR